MRKISQSIYDRLDNAVYSAQGHEWWQPDSAFYQMRIFLNPVRVEYAKRKLIEEAGIDPKATAALDVGSGGGFLAEEISRLGFDTTGVDPSAPSVEAAARHARENGLNVRYRTGTGESLPFEDGSFGVVFCCDVLEHVRNLPRVLSEISRVLKPGGVFCYDTFNRTWLSHLAAIKISQVWKPWAFMPPNLHVWRMFIKLGEMKSLLRQNGLEWKEHRGLIPDIPIPRLLGYLRKRARGEWTYAELAARVRMVESRITAVMYMGCAQKQVVKLQFQGNPFRGGDGCRPDAPVREGGPAGGGGNRLRRFPGRGEARGDILSKAEERDIPVANADLKQPEEEHG